MERPTTNNRLGGCPYCGDNDGLVELGGVRWLTCDLHMTKWRAGGTRPWRNETGQLWRDLAELLQCYREVEPVDWEPSEPPEPDPDNPMTYAEKEAFAKRRRRP
jgi:hypothetical protein